MWGSWLLHKALSRDKSFWLEIGVISIIIAEWSPCWGWILVMWLKLESSLLFLGISRTIFFFVVFLHAECNCFWFSNWCLLLQAFWCQGGLEHGCESCSMLHDCMLLFSNSLRLSLRLVLVYWLCFFQYLKDSIDGIINFFESSNAVSQTIALETAAAVQVPSI